MREYLLFRLYGPMAAWGDIAVGEYRPSYERPSKSAIIGMLAAALGIRRNDETAQAELSMAYGMASKSSSLGGLLRDYHTIQRPSAGRDTPYRTRKDEMEWHPERINTTISTRDYRTDSMWAVAIWQRGTSAPYTLHAISEALERPVFTLYLGRKSCPLALPLKPQIHQGHSMKEVFAKAEFCDPAFFRMMKDVGFDSLLPQDDQVVLWYWDDDGDMGMNAPTHQLTRRDLPLSRERWQFTERNENLWIENSKSPADEGGVNG